MFVAGERCDVETLEWAKASFGVPVLDHWWQTGEQMKGATGGKSSAHKRRCNDISFSWLR